MSHEAAPDSNPSGRIERLERAVNRLLLPELERLESAVNRLEQAAASTDGEIQRLYEENERLLAENAELRQRPAPCAALTGDARPAVKNGGGTSIKGNIR